MILADKTIQKVHIYVENMSIQNKKGKMFFVFFVEINKNKSISRKQIDFFCLL